VLEECQRLLDRGIRELCIIGQDLGSYNADEEGLCGLLEKMSQFNGKFWLRLLYIHPDNYPFPVLNLMEKDERFLPYFDIPFQHGSAKILKMMNRRGRAETYINLIETIRSRLSSAVIRSTFMTGFPGETEEDFQMLLDFQEKARLDWMGCFTYSREENTPAYSLKNRVSKKTAAWRKRILEERQIPITEDRMDFFIGKEADVLVEEKFESAAENTLSAEDMDILSGEENLYLGRLPCQAPDVDGSAVISSSAELVPGSLVHGHIFARRGFDLEIMIPGI
jgi:ribosomal protein S12 methylthiotransferase